MSKTAVEELTFVEVQRRLKVSKHRLLKLINANAFTRFKAGEKFRYLADEVDRWNELAGLNDTDRIAAMRHFRKVKRRPVNAVA